MSLSKIEVQFNAAIAYYSSECKLKGKHRKARIAAYAAMWYIENVNDDTKGGSNVFFIVRELSRGLD